VTRDGSQWHLLSVSPSLTQSGAAGRCPGRRALPGSDLAAAAAGNHHDHWHDSESDAEANHGLWQPELRLRTQVERCPGPKFRYASGVALALGHGPLASPTSSWWTVTTTPSSTARCSAPLSRAWARASSSAQRTVTTRTPTPRWSGPTASSAIRCASANGRKDNWDVHLLPAEFAINNAASTLGDGLTPSSSTAAGTRNFRSRRHAMTVRQARRRSTTRDGCSKSRRLCGTRQRELLAAAQAERKAKLDTGRVDTVFAVGAATDQRAARRRRHR
jgi:hypothetical protein